MKQARGGRPQGRVEVWVLNPKLFRQLFSIVGPPAGPPHDAGHHAARHAKVLVDDVGNVTRGAARADHHVAA